MIKKIFSFWSIDKTVGKIFLVLIAWFLIYLPLLGKRELQGNEPRRILPAKTMLKTGDWITPELAGQKYYKKPPLINWLIAVSFKIFGDSSERSARIVSAIATLIMALFLLSFNSSVNSSHTPLIIVLIYLSSVGVIIHGRLIEIEAAFTAFTGIASLCWLNSFSAGSRGLKLWLFPSILIGFGLLMKGPIILMFFYVLIICVLHKTQELKELYSPAHIIGILAMLLIFFLWALNLDALNSPSGGATTTWKHEVLDRMNPIGIDYGHWAQSIFHSAFFFLPWVIFLPLAWSRELAFESSLKENIFKSSRTALIINFAIVNLIPDTQARYSVPLLPLFAYVCGIAILSGDNKKFLLKAWRTFLLVLNNILIILIFLSSILLHSGLLEKIIAQSNTLKSNALFPFSTPAFFTTLLFFLIAIYAYFLVFKYRDSLYNVYNLCMATLAQTILFMLLFFIIVIPFEQMFDKKKYFAKNINEAVPENIPIYVLNVGYQPFLYYLREPNKSIYNFESLSKTTEYVLTNESTYSQMLSELKKTPSLFNGRQFCEIRKIKYKKYNYYLLKFLKENNSSSNFEN